MMRNDQLPRQVLLWVVIGLFIVLWPHHVHLAWLIWPLAIACIGWRSLIHVGKKSFPGAIIKTVLVLGAFAVLQSVFRGGAVMDGSAALLAVAACLKLVEMRTRRDTYVILFLFFFLIQSSFLYDRSILAAAQSLLGVFVIVGAMISLNVLPLSEQETSRNNTRIALVMLLQSLPIMLVLFVFFPRLGPLWSVGLDTGEAKIGLSQSMSPGDLSGLSASDELAFRVTFKSQAPPYNQLYWRAMVFDLYDGKTWSQSQPTQKTTVPVQTASSPNNDTLYDYEIIQEATDQSWLFALDTAIAKTPNTHVGENFNLLKSSPVFQRYRYQVTSDAGLLRDLSGLTDGQYRQSLQLPRGNEKTREMAASLIKQYPEMRKRVNAALAMYRQKPFYYTLKPPYLNSNDKVDEFLFDSKQGYCAHFAGSFVFLMRAAGIPARVVVGYMGGEYNEEAGYYSIYQFDAHAWAEVWLPDKGWVSVDPTAQVAPDRVLYGLEDALADRDDFLEGSPLSLMKVRSISWLNDIRLKMQSLNYYWYRWVLSYDNSKQKSLIKQFFGDMNGKKLLTVVVVIVASLIAIISLIVLRSKKPKPKPPLDAVFGHFQRILVIGGVDIISGEGPGQLVARAINAIPSLEAELNAFLQSYVSYQYGGAELNKYNLATLKKQLNELKNKIRKS